MTRFSILAFSLTLIFSNSVFAETFGAKLSSTETPLSLSAALTQRASKNKSAVLIKAKVEKVCRQKGCWMALKEESHEVRVTFKDYGFFVPASLIGKTVLVEGKLEEKKMSLKETKHYVKDEGGNPDSVKEARSEFRIVASGVQSID